MLMPIHSLFQIVGIAYINGSHLFVRYDIDIKIHFQLLRFPLSRKQEQKFLKRKRPVVMTSLLYGYNGDLAHDV